MTVLLSTAMLRSHCRELDRLTTELNFATSQLSDRHKLTGESLTEKMVQAYRLDAQSPDFSQHAPGKAWQLMASDLILANADNDRWGWASPLNVYFLDFWASFEPDSFFILGYTTLYRTLFDSLVETDVADLSTITGRWQAFHEELLKFFHENEERCLLVDIDRMERDIPAFTNALGAKVAFDLQSGATFAQRNHTESNIVRNIAASLHAQHSRVDQLTDELENSADLSGSGLDDVTEQSFNNAWEEIICLQKSLTDLKSELRNSKSDLRNYKSEISALESTVSEMETGFSGQDVKLLQEESILLSEQLRQTQSELKYYFSKYQKLKNAKTPTSRALPRKDDLSPNVQIASETVTSDSTDTTIIDFESFVDGENWYHAEPGGRWAGPGLKSSITLPQLDSGRYRLEIQVVDAMNLQTLKNTRVQFNNNSLVTKLRIRDDMSGALAPLRRLKMAAQKVQEIYPALIRSYFRVEQDSRQNQIYLEFPETISPASSGGSDSRSLSIRVKEIRIHRV